MTLLTEINSKIDKKEIQNLRNDYDNASSAKSKNSELFVWFCSRATIMNQPVAFVAVSRRIGGKENRLKISNKISSLFATYQSFVGKMLTPAEHIDIINENDRTVVQFQIFELHEYTQDPDASWATFKSIFFLNVK